jgi:hypothetical protein
MLSEVSVFEAIRLLDQELSSRLRTDAVDSVEWAEKLCDLLNEALETHCRTLEGVEQLFARKARLDEDGELRDYLTLCQEQFSNLMRDSFTALQIQDVTKQAIDRACDALEKRESILSSHGAEGDANVSESLQLVLQEYIKADDLHRTSAA